MPIGNVVSTSERLRLPKPWNAIEEETPEDPLTVNFQEYANRTIPDIILTNGSIECEAHTEVLTECSVKFCNSFMINGVRCELRFSEDISDRTLEFVYNFIYEVPNGKFRDPDAAKDLISGETSDFPAIDMTTFFSECCTLIVKYDFEMLRAFLLLLAKANDDLDGKQFKDMHYFAANLGLNDICEALEDAQANRDCSDMDEHILMTFGEAMILKMMEKHDFDAKYDFFELCGKYAIAKRSFPVLKAVKAVELQGDVSTQLEHEIKKNDIMIKYVEAIR